MGFAGKIRMQRFIFAENIDIENKRWYNNKSDGISPSGKAPDFDSGIFAGSNPAIPAKKRGTRCVPLFLAGIANALLLIRWLKISKLACKA